MKNIKKVNLFFVIFKYFLILFLFNIFFIFYLKSFALQIKNINYSASNNNDRWIELYNDGADIIDFTDGDYFKIYTSKSTVQTGHSINLLQGIGNNIPANSSFYITALNIPSGANKVFKSSYSLDKDNGFFSIINKDRTGQYICQNYGNISCPSLSIINLSNQNNTPPINNENNTSSTTNSTSTNNNNNSTNTIVNTIYNTQYIYIEKNAQEKYGDIKILFPENKIITAGVENDYSLKVIDSKNTDISPNLNFHFSFGDGGEKSGQNVRYIYYYPGEYNLVGNVDGYSSGGKIFSKIKVLSPKIKIINIGNEEKKENYIEIENIGDEDVYLSNFLIKVNGVYFKLANNFFIKSKEKIKLAGENIGFNIWEEKYNYNNFISTTTKIINVSIHYPNTNKEVLDTFYYIKHHLSSTSTNLILDTKIENMNKEIKIRKKVKPLSETEDFSVEKYIDFSLNNINNLNEINVLNRVENQVNKGDSDNKEIENKENISESTDFNIKKDIGIIKWLKNVLYFK